MGLSITQRSQQGLELLAQTIIAEAQDEAFGQEEFDELVSEKVRDMVGELNEQIATTLNTMNG